MRKQFLLASLLFIIIPVVFAQNWDRQMKMKSCNIQVRADQFTATTFIEWEFYNTGGEDIEGLHQFTLEPGQVITAFQLELNGKYRDGSIEEKWKATNTYNTIVGKRIDPALLRLEYGNNYSLRIFPVPAKGSRKVTLTIQQILKTDNEYLHYKLPLAVRESVTKFYLDIQVTGAGKPEARNGLIGSWEFEPVSKDNYALRWDTRDILLQSPVNFRIPIGTKTTYCTKAINEQTHFVMRVRPSAPKEVSINPQSLTVYWDASGSYYRRDIEKELSFLHKFISYHNIETLSLIPFNHKLIDTAHFVIGNTRSNNWQQYLRELKYDGALQLGIIDISRSTADINIVVSDGHHTFGRKRPLTGKSLTYCVTSSPSPHNTNLVEIVGVNGGRVIDLHSSTIAKAIRDCSKADTWLLAVKTGRGNSIIHKNWPASWQSSFVINGLLHGREEVLYLEYCTGRALTKIDTVHIQQAECSESLANRISMLQRFSIVLQTSSWNDIVDFGLKERVVTPQTAYIVLERIEDYIKYNITPPADLVEACEKMNYVKRDTRSQRRFLEQADEFTLLNTVVNAYNDRIHLWDPNARNLTLEMKEFEINVAANAGADLSATFLATNDNVLEGRVAGLNVSSSSLQEVVVVGYGNSLKRDLTTSVTSVHANGFFNFSGTVEQALAGKVAGLHVSNNGGSMLNSPATVNIRGVSSLNGSSMPLYVLDGMPINGNINSYVNVNDIASITVLRDAASASIYGGLAAHGAIIIETKKGKKHGNSNYNRQYRLSDMEDVEYMQEIKDAQKFEKLAVYEKLKLLHPNEPAFYFDMAQYFFVLGFSDKAFNILMNAAEVSGGEPAGLVAVAYILESWKRYDEAILVYEQLIGATLYDIKYHRDLAWSHYALGNHQEAIKILFNAIKMSTANNWQADSSLRASLLDDMNAIISMHKEQLDISFIPVALLRPMPVDLRILVECNKGNYFSFKVKEPRSGFTDSRQPSKTGGHLVSIDPWYPPKEYRTRNANEGKYKISVHYYDYNNYPGRVPSMIRIRTFKNYGKKNQEMNIENVIMDNQAGEIEIATIELEKK